jgi:hypothetical protein
MAVEHAPASIGDNGGPPLEEPAKLSGRNAVEVHVGDLLTEASNWADGVPLESQEQADQVAKLVRMLEQAGRQVDATADEEKRPHNDALTEIGAWQNGYTAEKLKKTPDGKITVALGCAGPPVHWLAGEARQRAQGP